MKNEQAIQLFKDCLKKIEQEDLTCDEADSEVYGLPLPDAYDVAMLFQPIEGDRHYMNVTYSLRYKGKMIDSQTLSVCSHFERDERFTRSGKEAVTNLINNAFKK